MTKVRYKLPQAGASEAQLKILAPYLVGETPREDGEWDMFCPLHKDSNRSAQLNVEKGQWYCHAGCGGGNVAGLIAKKSEWIEPTAAARNGHAKPRNGKAATETITEAKIAGWQSALMSHEVALDDLVTSRGLWSPTLAAAEIGWDKSRECYTIPIRDKDGKILNVRRYEPRPKEGRRKIWSVEGMGGAFLYPLSSLKSDSVIICEGEWDALVTSQHGFPAITRTASAVTWKSAWNPLFKDKIVYLAHDMDDAGQDANRKVGRALAKVAKEVFIVRLPYPLRPKGGKDLTDWWLDHESDPDEFKRLLEEATPFNLKGSEDPEQVGPSEVAVLDSFDSKRVGRPLRLTVTIKGKRDPGYSVPRKTRFVCSRDAGRKCEDCPLFESGDDTKVIAGADPIVLELMDSSKLQIMGALRRDAGIPECTKLDIEIVEHQSVEVLFARPSVDHMNGQGAGDYKNIKLTSVGRHDTQPNNTVQIVGALHPDPRKQLNEFLTWDVARMETSLDRFELDSETIEMLKTFQPSPGQRPLKKLREISDDLSAHVTRIYGRPQLHAAMDLVFHSALAFNFDGARVSRGWLEMLVVGDPRTGKSEVAQRLTRHYKAGEVISCETASLAGIVGGLQQFGASKEWAITWGAIPLNDRRLVVLDEVGGLEPEDISQMSSIRSSGIAELTKIATERTYARTRTIWLGNPRNSRMSDYTYGVQAIRPLIGNAEDIARFDLAMSVSAGEVPSSAINRERVDTKAPRYSSEACSLLVRWAWSRAADQILWAPGAEKAVYAAAGKLGTRYVEDPPLIQVANVREKVARIAVALAIRTYSTDDTGERVIVKKAHVVDAVALIDMIYGMPGFGYAERSRELIGDRREARRRSKDVRTYLSNKPWLAKFLRSAGKFRRQDLEEIGNIDREQANAIINTLWDARMVVKDRGDIRLTPTLHDILREVTVR